MATRRRRKRSKASGTLGGINYNPKGPKIKAYKPAKTDFTLNSVFKEAGPKGLSDPKLRASYGKVPGLGY